MGWQWHQLDNMQIICTSLQAGNHPSILSLNFYSSCRQPSVKALQIQSILKIQDGILRILPEGKVPLHLPAYLYVCTVYTVVLNQLFYLLTAVSLFMTDEGFLILQWSTAITGNQRLLVFTLLWSNSLRTGFISIIVTCCGSQHS